MYKFKVKDKTYDVYFGYGVLCQSDLIDRVMDAMNDSTEDEPAEKLKKIIGLTGELLLAGLQKNYSEEYGYNDSEEYKAQLSKVFNLLDEYEDEATEEEKEAGQHDGFSLFIELQEEMSKNGFIRRLMEQGAKKSAKKAKAAKVAEIQKAD